MTETSLRIPLCIWLGWLMLSLFWQTGPILVREQLQAGWLSSSALLLSPMQMFFVNGDNNGVSNSSNAEQLKQALAENRTLAQLVADLRAENSQLQQTASPLAVPEESSLVKLDAVRARIIGQRGDVLSDSMQLLVALGSEQGILEGELVLTGQGLLIDQGAAQGVSPDQLITAGRGLFGRTVQVGKQTALIQPITSPEFRMAVRIIRRSALGAVQGPQGILAGTGKGCRVDEVTATEAVAVGDEVYTDRLVSPGAEPIYCGRVTRAEAQPGENHWTITVAPLHSSSSTPARLFVLRTALNPIRLPPPP